MFSYLYHITVPHHFMYIYGYAILPHVHWYTRTPLYQTLCHHYWPTDTLDTVLHVNIWYATQDTILLCSWPLIHRYSTLSFHVPVSPSHRQSNTLSTIDYIIICYIIYHYFMLFHVHLSLWHSYRALSYSYCMFVNHWYTDMLLHPILLHWYAVHSYFMFLLHCNTDSPVYMYWLSMYSCCIDHGL